MITDKVALINIGDIILDWTNEFDKWARINYNYDGPKLSESPKSLKELNLEIAVYNFARSCPKNLPPLPYVRESLNQLIKLGYKIVFLHEGIYEHLSFYINSNQNLEILNIHFDLNVYGGILGKLSVIDEYEPDLYIDTDEISGIYARNYGKSYLIETSYNKDLGIGFKNLKEVVKNLEKENE